jgi:PAS domain-containing protein
VLIASDGRYLDANATALELLGVDLPTLQAHHVGDFTVPEYRDASRASWQHLAATGQTQYLIDETFLLRPDGTATVVKVHPVVPGDRAGTWWAQFELIDGPRGRVLSLAKPQQVLSAWRAAERRAGALEPGSWEREAAERTASGLGALYRAALDLRLRETAETE